MLLHSCSDYLFIDAEMLQIKHFCVFVWDQVFLLLCSTEALKGKPDVGLQSY